MKRNSTNSLRLIACIITQLNVEIYSTLLQAFEEPFLSCHVTRCSIVIVPDAAACGACHASYQTKVLVEVFAELLHLCRTCHLGIVLLLAVWALEGKVSWLVADKTFDLGHVNVLLTTLLFLCLTLALPC